VLLAGLDQGRAPLAHCGGPAALLSAAREAVKGLLKEAPNLAADVAESLALALAPSVSIGTSL